MSCDKQMNLDFDRNVHEIANAESERQYNCTTPFLPAIASNVTGVPPTICADEKIGKKSMALYDLIETSLRENTPCSRMDIFLGIPFYSTETRPYKGFGYNDTAFILLYFKSSIKVKSTIWDYDLIRLVAEIGGYTGLLVGFPIARGVIWINSIILQILMNKKKTGKFFTFYI